MSEKGFSLIESVVVIMLSTVIVMGIQVSIGNIISSTVQNYTAATITNLLNEISQKIQNKCAQKAVGDCKEIISIEKYNNDKFKITIDKISDGNNKYEILAIYQRSENENGSIEPFVKRTASIYGYPSGNNIVSVLGEWTVPLSKYELLKKDESKGKAAYHFYKKVLLSD
ncbi:type IV pilus modification PilV family protein [Escherichia coli]|uniref:type IV pilus modification PilV family protein n=1 Tax=Escherichia coli TaxID=562 RepID=UPI0006A225F0|nr:prepilin-type N-terminal cleavage/methylation domain-containing protein [Escherichia coli]EHY3390274.1 prepilin-type N-terminal cleavage/methylation domain-containing protein [Escherichia coli]CTU36635.1 prepilin [Escherichia coli]CTV27024.1 prepilin [Escherichia coli]CTV67102.1 prepilin [Escherichia coli]CTV86044.1 prepilin [Escherichia coli]